MKISEMIEILTELKELYGDLPIVGGYLVDDRSPSGAIAIDNDGVSVCNGGKEPTGVFIE